VSDSQIQPSEAALKEPIGSHSPTSHSSSQRMQPQQARERDDHVDVALPAADHVAREPEAGHDDERREPEQHPGRPLPGTREFRLQADALAEQQRALGDLAVGIRCAGGRGAQGLRVVERTVLLGPSDRLGDHRVRKGGFAQRGVGQQGPFAASLYLYQSSRPGAGRGRANYARRFPAGHDAPRRRTGPRAAPFHGMSGGWDQRRPKNESTATTTTTRPTM